MSKETALARNFAEFTDEEIGELIEFLRKEGLDPCDDAADLIESQAAELEALRERVKEQDELLDMVYDDLCTTPNGAVRKSTALKLLERDRGLSTGRDDA